MPRSTALRLSLFYAALMAPSGVQTAFMPIWFVDRGITPAELGAIGFATILARTLTSPLVGSWVDRSGRARLVAMAFSWLAVVGFAPHLWAAGFWALLVAHVGFSVLRSPPLPLGEALTLATARREGLDYGRIRVWGSVSFLALAVGGGPLIDATGPWIIAWLILALIAVAAVGAHLLPRESGAPIAAPPRAPVRFLLTQPVVLVFLAAASLIQASHAVFYAYGSLHWLAVGLSQSEIGLLWGVGVGAEIAMFWFAGRIVARIGPAWLILAGGLAAVPRWILTADATGFWPLAGLQILHAATYGLTHLGTMHFIVRMLPATHAASAQTLTGAAINLAMGATMWATGPLYAAWGGGVYWTMAACAGLGALACVKLVAAERRLSARRPPSP